MDESIKALFAARRAGGPAAYDALVTLFKLTERPVPWAHDIWPELVADLRSKDDHRRSFAGQMLCRLEISDEIGRMHETFADVVELLEDRKFVVARHVLQSFWRVGTRDLVLQKAVLEIFARRFEQCASERNGALVRSDILEGVGTLSRFDLGTGIERFAEYLMSLEPDPGARRKQLAAWRKGVRSTEACYPPIDLA